MTKRSFDQRELRRAFGTFATGVTIVTTSDGNGTNYGFTANSFTSVSLDPPLILVCLAKSAGSCGIFQMAKHYAVSILSEEQRQASAAFATPGIDRFAKVGWSKKATGAPVIEGSAAWLDCSMHQTVDAGDHIILIGHVEDYDYNTRSPLGYCRGAYVTFGLDEDTLRMAEQTGALKVGGIIEHSQKILLQIAPATGDITLPIASNFGPESNPHSLLGKLAKAGYKANIPFLYSAYNDEDHHFVFYRGEAWQLAEARDAPGPFQLFEPSEIPWDEIKNSAVKSMLQRYVTERDRDEFGIYVGDAVRGTISHLGGGGAE